MTQLVHVNNQFLKNQFKPQTFQPEKLLPYLQGPDPEPPNSPFKHLGMVFSGLSSFESRTWFNVWPLLPGVNSFIPRSLPRLNSVYQVGSVLSEQPLCEDDLGLFKEGIIWKIAFCVSVLRWSLGGTSCDVWAQSLKSFCTLPLGKVKIALKTGALASWAERCVQISSLQALERNLMKALVGQFSYESCDWARLHIYILFPWGLRCAPHLCLLWVWT